MDLNVSKLLISSPVRLDGDYFTPTDLIMGVSFCLREVSAYGRLKIWSFSREITGTTPWCPLMGGSTVKAKGADH